MRADTVCTASALSTPQRNSLASIFSLRSNATGSSAASSASFAISETDKSPACKNNVTSAPRNHYSPFPAQHILYVCKACNEECKNQYSLDRHYKEQCESTGRWYCTLCLGDKSYSRKDRFVKHHLDHHAQSCPNGCDKDSKSLCADCLHLLHRCFRDLPEKVAWGCPCCLSYFDARDAWELHSTRHGTYNREVMGWSLSTLAQSLMLHRDLSLARSKFDWQHCNFSRVTRRFSTKCDMLWRDTSFPWSYKYIMSIAAWTTKRLWYSTCTDWHSSANPSAMTLLQAWPNLEASQLISGLPGQKKIRLDIKQSSASCIQLLIQPCSSKSTMTPGPIGERRRQSLHPAHDTRLLLSPSQTYSTHNIHIGLKLTLFSPRSWKKPSRISQVNGSSQQSNNNSPSHLTRLIMENLLTVLRRRGLSPPCS